MAFAAAGLDHRMARQGVDETGVDARTGTVRVRINPAFYRPAEVEQLIGNADKARAKLGWRATTTLEALCRMMVEADLARVERGVTF